MLPPFVPPSARVANAPLPMITEFVIDRVDHSREATLVATPEFTPQRERPRAFGEELPSIDDFLWRPRLADEPDALGPIGATAAQDGIPADLPQEHAPIPSGTLAFVEPELEDAHPAGVPAPIVNDEATEGAAWSAAAADAALEAREVGGAPPEVDEPSGEAEAALTPASEVPHQPVAPQGTDSWVTEERDAFDWQGVASLAAGPDEERRAAEDWSSTQWEKSSPDAAQDHVAGLLSQVARRVRSGELTVQGSRQMTPEAALAAVLAALLSDQGSEA